MVEGLKGVKVVGVSAGRGHTVICTADGRVWTVGDGECGQLGHRDGASDAVVTLITCVCLRPSLPNTTPRKIEATTLRYGQSASFHVKGRCLKYQAEAASYKPYKQSHYLTLKYLNTLLLAFGN